MIEVKMLTKSYGKKLAVDHISFKINDGEIFGLLGPNAAGKTTTVRLLSTILKPDSGTAVINGMDVVENPRAVRKMIGALPEEVGLYDRLTPREMLQYYGRLQGMDKTSIIEGTKMLFEKLELADFADARNSTLSKGTKQKVSVARAFLHNPPVLFLDEPTAGIDVMSSRAIKDMIKRAKNQRKTILFSTHIMPEAEKICDRIAIIDKGRIIATGTLSELKSMTQKADLEDVFVRLVEENM